MEADILWKQEIQRISKEQSPICLFRLTMKVQKCSLYLLKRMVKVKGGMNVDFCNHQYSCVGHFCLARIHEDSSWQGSQANHCRRVEKNVKRRVGPIH